MIFALISVRLCVAAPALRSLLVVLLFTGCAVVHWWSLVSRETGVLRMSFGWGIMPHFICALSLDICIALGYNDSGGK